MIVGLTGKSCSGKDSVSRMLGDNFATIDVDKLGHIALEKNKERLVECFGEGIISGQTIDRKKLANIVFSDKKKLTQLNNITHPWMVKETLRECREIENKGKIAVINCALLESMGFVKYCDEIIYVESSYPKRLERALKRDSLTAEAFKKRDDNQKEIGILLFSSGKKVFKIINDAGLEELSRQVNLYCDNIGKRGYYDEKI